MDFIDLGIVRSYMSRWRCGICKKIVDSFNDTCCGIFYPDDKWTELDHEEAEKEFLKQELKESKKISKLLLEKIEKMKCCENCKKHDVEVFDGIYCTLKWDVENLDNNCIRKYRYSKIDHWELDE